MSDPKWHEGHMTGLDTETTGTDPLNARIVTAAIVHTKPGARPRTMQWVIDPGVEIPAEADAVHGWTNDRLAAELPKGAKAMRFYNGQRIPLASPESALNEIATQVATVMGVKSPVVVHNAAYDLTLLETELVRWGIDPLASRPTGVFGVVDPMVIEKQYDPWRKACYKAPGCDVETQHHECGGCRGGKYACEGCGSTNRQLESLCRHYGIVHAGAHDASADTIAAMRLAKKLAGLWPEIARWKLETLHRNQVAWRRTQQDGLRKFFDKVGKEHDGMCPSWPVHGACCAGQAAVA